MMREHETAHFVGYAGKVSQDIIPDRVVRAEASKKSA